METSFREAANRRAHELARLNEAQKSDLQQRLTPMVERNKESLRQERQRQDETRAQDIEAQMSKIMRSEPQPRPHGRQFGRKYESMADVQRAAEKAVDRAHQEEIQKISAMAAQNIEACIEAFLASIPEFRAERASTEAQRQQWAERRAATEVEFGIQGPTTDRRNNDGDRDR